MEETDEFVLAGGGGPKESVLAGGGGAAELALPGGGGTGPVLLGTEPVLLLGTFPAADSTAILCLGGGARVDTSTWLISILLGFLDSRHDSPVGVSAVVLSAGEMSVDCDDNGTSPPPEGVPTGGAE